MLMYKARLHRSRLACRQRTEPANQYYKTLIRTTRSDFVAMIQHPSPPVVVLEVHMTGRTENGWLASSHKPSKGVQKCRVSMCRSDGGLQQEDVSRIVGKGAQWLVLQDDVSDDSLSTVKKSTASSLTRWRLRNASFSTVEHLQSMDDTRDVTQYRQKDIDQQIATASTLEEDT